ncbi:hypothetical protein GCM10022225_49370 [Plantactinospora mayteni]|uniref:Uncharacterized protein n=1 Tax=Plantactinospora mayteni TaxID=566021 RepID=A0ABQ4EXR4_9ACTN|nr:hypothetical protein Pma05_60080 [Plantactinospora mayteni]
MRAGTVPGAVGRARWVGAGSARRNRGGRPDQAGTTTPGDTECQALQLVVEVVLLHVLVVPEDEQEARIASEASA